ncbi:hypothetical protein TNCV_1509911 [Trichonephila clavipes]|nr:hypothetical protein TNCV_1509911 [Trichonephila clavipes]
MATVQQIVPDVNQGSSYSSKWRIVRLRRWKSMTSANTAACSKQDKTGNSVKPSTTQVLSPKPKYVLSVIQALAPLESLASPQCGGVRHATAIDPEDIAVILRASGVNVMFGGMFSW